MDFERYNRNILIKEIGEDGQKKLLNTRVLVAGAGGLGSTVIANLASVGVGTIGLVDKDVIEISNYNRQYLHKFQNIGKEKVLSAKEWVSSYNPGINIETYNLELTKENAKDIIKNYDIIVDCFDSYESKFLLNKLAIQNRIPLIHGGITEFSGQVTTILPGQSACLNCLFPDPEINTYIPKGVISPAVTTIGAIEAMEVLKLVLSIGEPLVNILLTYYALSTDFKKIKLTKNKQCPVCSKICAIVD